MDLKSIVLNKRMKFLPTIIQISSCLSQNLADPCGAPDIPGPSHRLFYRYSKLHSQLPISGGPNNACPKQGTLVGEDTMNGLSTFSQVSLCSGKEDTQHAYGYGHCLPHLSGHERSQNHISEPKGPDNDAEITLQNIIAVLGRPYYMAAQIAYNLHN